MILQLATFEAACTTTGAPNTRPRKMRMAIGLSQKKK